ncbi:MAG TPA: sodium:solute symporter [Longimicrobiaceae bacterium]|nr:sodium:solute symporter [Longimicrobiaceae bacterium]
MSGGFTALDFLVLALYIVGVTGFGMWLGRGQEGAKDYFLGGNNLPWGAVLFSVVATETSTLTFLSIPGVAYVTDLGFLQLTFGYLIGRVVVAFVLLPAYYRGHLTTAYGLLEERFGLSTRRFASAIFMFTRALADGVRLFATAIPLALITGWSYPVSILVMGVFTLVYTYHGGIRSVVWVDAIQMVIYLGGAIGALAVLIAAVPGGWGGLMDAAGAAGKLHLFQMHFTWSEPFTLWSGLLGGAFLSMASHGADQLIVQRLLTCKNLKDSQLALIGSGVMVILQFALFLVIGLALWSFYGGRTFARTDEIFATFIIQQLPPGVTGLVIAAIFAAAMSSLASSVNSLASASTYDFYAALRGGTEAELFRVGRISTLIWGVVLVGGALLFRSQDTPVVELGLAIASFTYGGLLGGFFLAILNRRANQRDALWGIGTGIVVMSAIVFAKWYVPIFTAVGLSSLAVHLRAIGTVAWPWFVVIGTLITFLVGSLLSLTHGAVPDGHGHARGHGQGS